MNHQLISGELFRQFSNYLVGKPCKVFSAPFDVRLFDNSESDEDVHTVVQPDLLIVCNSAKLDKRGCKGAPDLIVEILSPASAALDRKIKRNLYEKAGVKEYWIVDQEDKTVDVYKLYDGKYGKPDIYADEDKVNVDMFEGLEVDFRLVFDDE